MNCFLIMNTKLRFFRQTAILAGICLTVGWSVHSQTVIWHRQALGQTFICPIRGNTWGWPNNNNWSQHQIMGDPCSENDWVVAHPSNWSTPNYPDGASYDVVLGSWGGTPANLDMGVTLHSLTIQSDGGLNMQFGSSITASAVDLQGDSGITVGGGGGGWPEVRLLSGGNLIKSSGTNASVIAPGVLVTASNSTFTVASGTLSLPGNGSTYANCTFSVAPGTTLNLVPPGQSVVMSGAAVGIGGGTVSFSDGTLAAGGSGVALNFSSDMFQWSGGQMIGPVSNTNVVTISGGGTVSLGGVMYNSCLMRQIGTSSLAINWSSRFESLAAGRYELAGDGGLAIGGGGGGWPAFVNAGLFLKSSGTSTSTVAVPFINQGGTIRVNSGRLTLAGGGSGSNGVFQVAGGALLDITGGSAVTWQGVFTGSGGGTVLLGGGLNAGEGGVTLGFPGSLFQWTGGQVAGAVYNTNSVTISGGGTVSVSGVLHNAGLMRQTDVSTLAINWSSAFENQASGVYELAGDGGIVIGGGGGGWPAFANAGLLRKCGGTGTSTVATPFNNQNGSIEVASGTLNIGDYTQGSGALTIQMGGRGPGQTGRLSVNNSAVLGGALTVTLANGFAPAPGESFQILSCGSRSGVFSPLYVPAGISVNYSNTGVFLVVTGTVPAQLAGTRVSSEQFRFNFGTVSNQSYTVQFNDDLTTTNWQVLTNFTGDGAMQQIEAPVADAPQRFYRVKQP